MDISIDDVIKFSIKPKMDPFSICPKMEVYGKKKVKKFTIVRI